MVPGVLFAMVQKDPSITEEQKVRFLFTAGAFGFVVANNASISGAAGGCQKPKSAVPQQWQQRHL